MGLQPYYEVDGITIFHGDCLEVLPQTQAAELVFTDPPYAGLKGGYNRAYPGVAPTQGPSIAVGDPWVANLEWVPLLTSVLGVIVFCSHHSVPEVANAFRSWRRVALLTWWKRNAPPTGKNVPRFRSEFAWAFASGPGLSWDRFDDTVFEVPRISSGCFAGTERAIHPTQKPLRLIQMWLRLLSPKDVIDPFMGSGTTLVAARNLGCKAIGIEIEEKYCEVAARRLDQTVLELGA